MFLLLANRWGGSPNFGELETSKKCESHFVKTRAFLQLANEIASGGGSGTVDRDENLRYVWDGVWEGQEPGEGEVGAESVG